MHGLLRSAFFLLLVRPLVLLVLGLNVRHRERLPRRGPAVVVANHNSHLDTLVLMTLFPPRLLRRLRPVAAADYFLRNRALSWFSRRIIGIIPIRRSGQRAHDRPLEGIREALGRGDVVIVFPEGTRGEPERLSAFKSGVAHVARDHPGVPIVPVFLHGLGKALPRGETLLVPFFCDVFVGETLAWGGDRHGFLSSLEGAMRSLAAEGSFPPWD